MKSNVDYGWAVFLGIAVLVAVLWKPMGGFLGGVRDKLGNQEGYDRGKAIFYDATRWDDKQYKSCAMCHAKDYPFEAGRKVDIEEYKEGFVYELKGMRAKYYDSMGDDEKMVAAINKCMGMPTRMRVGSFSVQAPWMQDLVTYVKRQ